MSDRILSRDSRVSSERRKEATLDVDPICPNTSRRKCSLRYHRSRRHFEQLKPTIDDRTRRQTEILRSYRGCRIETDSLKETHRYSRDEAIVVGLAYPTYDWLPSLRGFREIPDGRNPIHCDIAPVANGSVRRSHLWQTHWFHCSLSPTARWENLYRRRIDNIARSSLLRVVRAEISKPGCNPEITVASSISSKNSFSWNHRIFFASFPSVLYFPDDHELRDPLLDCWPGSASAILIGRCTRRMKIAEWCQLILRHHSTAP